MFTANTHKIRYKTISVFYTLKDGTSNICIIIILKSTNKTNLCIINSSHCYTYIPPLSTFLRKCCKYNVFFWMFFLMFFPAGLDEKRISCHPSTWLIIRPCARHSAFICCLCQQSLLLRLLLQFLQKYCLLKTNILVLYHN